MLLSRQDQVNRVNCKARVAPGSVWLAGRRESLSLAGGRIPFAGQGNEWSALPIPSLLV